MVKKPKSASRDGFGILNPYGDFWSPHLFDSEEEAKAYFYRFWRGVKDSPDWSAYRVVPARQRITAIKPARRAALAEER